MTWPEGQAYLGLSRTVDEATRSDAGRRADVMVGEALSEEGYRPAELIPKMAGRRYECGECALSQMERYGTGETALIN